jgi:HlyD family secretion protein
MTSHLGKKGWLLSLLCMAGIGVGVVCKFNWSPAAGTGPEGSADRQPGSASSLPTQPTSAPAPNDAPASFAEADLLDYLHRLSPPKRMAWLGKVLIKDRDFKPVPRDGVMLALSEPGIVSTDSMAEVVSLVAGKIRWIASDGATVKKGDRILEIDDRARKEQLQKQNVLIAQNLDFVRLASETFAKFQKETQAEVKEAELQWKLAELTLKRFTGDDAAKKKKLQLQVEQTRQAVDRVKEQASQREAKASADLKTKKAVLDQLLVENLLLEGEVSRCILLAPRQGLVVYQLAPLEKKGETRFPSLRPGETVNQDQMVMCICDDLEQLHLAVRLDAARAGQVRSGQKAFVRVQDLPNRVFPAKVKHVSEPLASPPGSPTKFVTAKIELQGDHADARPGMTGGVRIVIDQRPDCLCLPLASVRANGKEKYCFVLAGEELQERQLTTGLANDHVVEIRSGVTADEQVLSLQAVMRRQAEYLKYSAK